MKNNKKETNLFKKLRSPSTINKAWHQIYDNGLKSDSKDTRNQIKDFKIEDRKNISRISRQLKNKTFIFDDNLARLVGDKKRPIVLAPVKSRIVQRAILDIIQNQENFQKYQKSIGSYGAIKKRGVKDAIQEVVKSVKKGATYYYKSDIKSFFTQISRNTVIEKISTLIDDKDFLEVLEKATNLEVKNINSIPKEKRDLFNFDNIGTPQGCCLSPLLGNIMLYEFDNVMNTNDIRCLRYLDDFIILGSDRKSVQGAFAKAVRILKKEGLSAYQISDENSKAKLGKIENGVNFLGIEILGKNIRPSKEARAKLLKAIKDIMNQTFKANFEDKGNKKSKDSSLISSLYHINNKIQGWGNQYSFCNEDAIWGSMDTDIDSLMKDYLGRYSKEIKKKNSNSKFRRRILGVHLLSESKKEPINSNL